MTDDESGESMELCHPKNWVRRNWRDYSAWLTERSRELISETRGSILEGTICYTQRRRCRWTSECDQKIKSECCEEAAWEQ